MMMSLKYYPLLGVSKCMRHVFQKLLWDHWQETSTQETTKKGSKLFVFCSLLGNNDSLGPQKSQVLRGGDASGV
jgi:hypothetical protein